MIFFLFFMRILGSLYTFIVGILVLMPSVFNSPEQMLSYVILDDLVFPFRDFIETLMFSYLFYYQSQRRRNLAMINEKWKKSEKGRSESAASIKDEHPNQNNEGDDVVDNENKGSVIAY